MDEDNDDTVQSQKYLSTLQVSRYCLFGFAEQYATVLYLRHAKFRKQHWEYWPEPIRPWEMKNNFVSHPEINMTLHCLFLLTIFVNI